jgi:1-deoxy-D-xylulose-5-phosphate synthase
MLVVLNDNGMSIAPGVGALTNYLSLALCRRIRSCRSVTFALKLSNKFPKHDCARRQSGLTSMPAAW